MAIDFDTFSERLRQLPNEVNGELQRATLSVSRGLKSIIQLRIQQTGINSAGSPLAPYSKKGIPAFLLEGRSLNQGGESAVEEAGNRGDLVSYEEFRSFQGLQTSHTDLTFTGEMWRQIDLVGSGDSKQFRVSIGPTSVEARNKLEWNSDRYGPILRPSQSEVNQSVQILENKLVELFNQAFE